MLVTHAREGSVYRNHKHGRKQTLKAIYQRTTHPHTQTDITLHTGMQYRTATLIRATVEGGDDVIGSILT